MSQQRQIRQKTISGLRWNSVSTIGLALGQLLLLLWSATQMPKSELGLMALLHTFIGFGSFFSDAGLTNFVLHDKDLQLPQYRYILRLNIFIGLITGALLVFTSGWLSVFFGAERLRFLLFLAGGSILGIALGSLHRALLRRDLRFGLVSKITIAAFLSGTIITVLLVIMGWGAWGLMWGRLINFWMTSIAFIWYGRHYFQWFGEVASPQKPAWWKFGMFQIGEQVVNYFRHRLDNLLVAKFLGLEVMGGYDLLKQLLGRPMMLISSISGQVLLPVLVAQKTEQKQLRSAYYDILAFNSSINFPFFIGIALLTGSFLTILPGENWGYWTSVVPLLSLLFLLQSTGSSAGLPAMSSGRADVSFYWNLALSLLVPFFVLTGLYWSLFGVVLSLVVMQLLLFFPNYFYLIKPFLGGRLKTYCAMLYRPFMLSLLAGSGAWLMQYWIGYSIYGFVAGAIFQLLLYVWLTFRYNQRFWSFCLRFVSAGKLTKTNNLS